MVIFPERERARRLTNGVSNGGGDKTAKAPAKYTKCKNGVSTSDNMSEEGGESETGSVDRRPPCLMYVSLVD